MNKIKFDDFSEMYKVRRNPISFISAYENTLVEFDDEGEELFDETDSKVIWTLVEGDDGLVVKPGREYKNVIGYFICKNKWNEKQESYILL